MREITNWKSGLIQKLADQSKIPRREASYLCDVELGLFLAEQLVLGESASVLSALLAGYLFSLPQVQGWSDKQQRMLAVGRHLLQYYQGRRRWEEALDQYNYCPEWCRLFSIESGDKPATRRTISVCPEREQVYADALQATPRHSESRHDFAQASGSYYFEHKRIWQSVRFPEWLFGQGESPTRSSIPPRVQNRRPPLAIRWKEIVATAAWMDAHEPEPDRPWRKRVGRMRLRLLADGESSDSARNDLILDGLFHLVGMVSSGKTTLMDIVAVWAARQGLRVTLVVGDVIEAVTRATLFQRMGLAAVPILGATNRNHHVERLDRVVAFEKRPPRTIPQEDARLRWASPICLLDGLWGGQPVIAPGEEPCERLYSQPSREDSPFLCPLVYHCPIYRAANEMPEAAIWVTTPASLLYTRVPRHLYRENMRMLELVYRQSDLVIVDEADRVQIQLDEAFGPADTLVASDGNGWLDRLARASVPPMGKGRGEYLTADTHRWGEAQRIAQQAADLIFTLLARNAYLQEWVRERDYFTGLSLILQLVRDLDSVTLGSKNTVAEGKLLKEFEIFLEDPLSQARGSQLAEVAKQLILTAGSKRVHDLLRGWLRGILGKKMRDSDASVLEQKLTLALATGVLEDRLKIIVDHWDVAEAVFNLGVESEWLFRRPPRDYGPLIPESPMGNLFGFRYVVREQGSPGELQFFRCAGVGRWLLLHLHELFDHLDGIKGPHVLLLSGTSWAPRSSSYHIQVPPNGVLEAPQEEVAGIRASQCMFEPAYTEDFQPVQVSGAVGHAREQRLRQVLSHIAGAEGSDGQTEIQRELEVLPPDRARILLVVGSYRETTLTTRYLRSLPGWGNKVLPLIPDSEFDSREWEGEVLPRGLIYRFAERPEPILIAPLLTVERGHNILIPEGRAAVGSVYFLVRPMPVPYSMSVALQRINYWAMEHYNKISTTRTGEAASLLDTWKAFRRSAMGRWHAILKEPGFYATLSDEERRGLCWTQLVALWQTVGRAIRGGESVRVHFCDAAFAPRSASHQDTDTPKTSLLLGLREVLALYLKESKSASAPTDGDLLIARLLYGPWAAALEHIRGIDE